MSPKSPMDFFLPKVVRGSITSGCDFRQLSETCTTWRGLSSLGAEELYYWTTIYHVVLQQHKRIGLYPVNSTIISDMVKRYEDGPPMGLHWFSSAPNIHQRVERFLAVTRGTPSLEIEHLEIPVIGQEYSLAPRVVGISTELDSDYSRQTVFTTSASWLRFDHECGVFSGIVPSSPGGDLIVKARLVDHLDERVRIEHVSRIKVNLRAVRPENCAERYPTTLYTESTTEGRVLNESTNGRKQVSFADEHETDSLRSSPDHLESFFNGLAALTCDPNQKISLKELNLTDRTPLEPSSSCINPGDVSSALSRGGEHVKPLEESGLDGESEVMSVSSIANGPRRRRLASANSSVQLYPHLRLESFERGENVFEKKTSLPQSETWEESNLAGHTVKHDLCNAPSCAHQQQAKRYRDKSLSFCWDTDTNLDLDVALGISNRVAVDCSADQNRSTPLPFQKHFDSLPGRNDMDRPIEICQSTACSETGPQHDSCVSLGNDVSGSKVPMKTTNKDGCRGSLQDLRNDLSQWNWRGWEQEIGINKRRFNRSFRPGLSRQSMRSNGPCTLDDNELEKQVMERAGCTDGRADNVQNQKTASASCSLDFKGKSLSPTLSSSSFGRISRDSSAASWTIDNEVGVLGKATNSVDEPATLYDTVRNQFYKDHRTRQLSSPRHFKTSSARSDLSHLFSSKLESPEVMENCPDYAHTDHAVSLSGIRNENKATTGSRMRELPLRSTSPVEPRPDIGPIAAAVKESLVAEVQGKDGREKVEIRKGILKHQFMELCRSERQRDFGSSTYDDIFWSSDGASAAE